MVTASGAGTAIKKEAERLRAKHLCTSTMAVNSHPALKGFSNTETSTASQQAVEIIDETAFLKKGTHSAEVARQYSGTAGRELPGGGLPGLHRGAGYTLLTRNSTC